MENSGREIAKESTRVADVMTRNVVTLRPEQTFAETVNLMSKHSFRHFPVIPARLVG